MGGLSGERARGSGVTGDFLPDAEGNPSPMPAVGFGDIVGEAVGDIPGLPGPPIKNVIGTGPLDAPRSASIRPTRVKPRGRRPSGVALTASTA